MTTPIDIFIWYLIVMVLSWVLFLLLTSLYDDMVRDPRYVIFCCIMALAWPVFAPWAIGCVCVGLFNQLHKKGKS